MNSRLLVKLFSVIIVVLIMFSVVPVSADQTFNSNKNIGMVESNIPYINVEIKDSKLELSDISGKVGSEKITAHSVISTADAKKMTYVLIDDSKSMTMPSITPDGSYDAIKKALAKLITDSTDGNNHFSAYAIGENDPVSLGVAVDKDSANNLSNKIKLLNGDSDGTNLNKGLMDIFNVAKENREGYQVVKVILVTDRSADFSLGVSLTEVILTYQYNNIPLYTVSNTDHENDNSFKELRSLSRYSGGEGYVYNYTKNKNTYKFISSLYKGIYNTSIATFITNVPVDNAARELAVSVKGIQYSETVIFDKAADISSPVEAKVKINDEQNAFIFSFTQKGFNGQLPVKDALNNENYKIKRSGTDKHLAVQKVDKNPDNTYTVTMKEDIYTDTYDFEFGSITDLSSNENKVKAIKGFDIKAKSKFWIVFPYLLIATIMIVILLIFYLILIGLKKKKNVNTIRELFVTQVNETVQERHYIQNVKPTQHGGRINLYFQTSNYPQKHISTNISSSIIVGRSDICDVYIDDAKMSRQHFAIEYTQNVYMISDLESANGTFVNGVKVRSRQRLNSGDMIIAGLTSIRIEF